MLTIEYGCDTIVIERSALELTDRGNPSFLVKAKKYTAASAVVTIRIPKDMINAIDKIAEITGRTRNEIITLGLEFALDNLEIPKE